MKKILALIFAALLATSSTSFAENLTIQETGYGQGPEGCDPKSCFYKTYARQAARLDALRHLNADIYSFEVELIDDDPERTISHITSNKLKNVRQVGEAEFDEDGICRITLEIVLRKVAKL